MHEADIDFGLIEIGKMSRSFFTMENVSPLQVAWSLSCVDAALHNDLFEFERDGSLAPLDKRRISVVFKPSGPVVVTTQLRIRIEDGNEMYINKHVCLFSCCCQF